MAFEHSLRHVMEDRIEIVSPPSTCEKATGVACFASQGDLVGSDAKAIMEIALVGCDVSGDGSGDLESSIYPVIY